jgi:hypothetical protein
MKLGADLITPAILIGLGASLMMDLWNVFLKRAFGIPSLNYCMLGRWISHMPTGTFRHSNISAAQPKPFECALGWISHYTIGVVFAFVLVLIASTEWLAQPTLLPALFVGIVTVVFPFFVLQPAIGLGVAASKTNSPMKARLKSLATHTVFGLGLYLCALAVREIPSLHP